MFKIYRDAHMMDGSDNTCFMGGVLSYLHHRYIVEGAISPPVSSLLSYIIQTGVIHGVVSIHYHLLFQPVLHTT